jgi:hypothetical protein
MCSELTGACCSGWWIPHLPWSRSLNNFIDLYCDVNPDQIHTGYQFWGYPQIVIDHDRSLSKSIPPLWINWVSIILHHLSPCWLQVFATWPCHASQIVGDLPQSRQLVLRLLSLQTGLGRYGTIIIVVGLIGWPWLFPKYLFSICFLLVCWILLILVVGPRVGMCWFGSPLSSLQMMTALATLLLLDLEMVESNCIQLHHHTSIYILTCERLRFPSDVFFQFCIGEPHVFTYLQAAQQL